MFFSPEKRARVTLRRANDKSEAVGCEEAALSSMHSHRQSQSPFFKLLPPEIRAMVYEYLPSDGPAFYRPTKAAVPGSFGGTLTIKDKCPVQSLLVCRRLYSELNTQNIDKHASLHAVFPTALFGYEIEHCSIEQMMSDRRINRNLVGKVRCLRAEFPASPIWNMFYEVKADLLDLDTRHC